MVPSCSAAQYYPKYLISPVYDLKRKSRFHFFEKTPPFLGGTVVKNYKKHARSIADVDITHSQLKMAQAMNEEDTVHLNLDDVNDDLASEVTIPTCVDIVELPLCAER